MRTLLLILTAGTVAIAQPVPNVSGKWQIEGGAGRGGRGGPQILMLNQVGDEVTGELGGGRNLASIAPVNNELWNGRVAGNTITFYMWRGSDRPAKVFYKGELNAAGDEITFSVTGGPRGGGAPAENAGAGEIQKAVAKRAR